MKHSLHVFVPEMSLSEDFPKQKEHIEREIGISDRDQSKPLLLRLLEQVKFGGAGAGGTFGAGSLSQNVGGAPQAPAFI